MRASLTEMVLLEGTVRSHFAQSQYLFFPPAPIDGCGHETNLPYCKSSGGLRSALVFPLCKQLLPGHKLFTATLCEFLDNCFLYGLLLGGTSVNDQLLVMGFLLMMSTLWLLARYDTTYRSIDSKQVI